MNEAIREAKTVEAAVEAALKELNCGREEVDIDVLQEPVKGIFGMAKMAKVRVVCRGGAAERVSNPPAFSSESHEDTKLHQPARQERSHRPAEQQDINNGQECLTKLLQKMGTPASQINAYAEEDSIILEVQSESEGLLIGRHGQTLSALQYLLNRMLKQKEGDQVRYIVDVGGYRSRHKMVLEKMANRVANRVAETKQEEQLEAMNAYDRRLIHMAVRDNPQVMTYSLGEGGFRRVVIAPKDSQKQTRNDL